jgi:sensitive to high expression protein 9
MRPLLQHASRSLFASLVPAAPQQARNAISRSLKRRVEGAPPICLACQFRASSVFTVRREGIPSSPGKLCHGQLRRVQFSSSAFPREEKKPTEPLQSIETPADPRRPLPEGAIPLPPIDTTPTQTGDAIPLLPPSELSTPPANTPETPSTAEYNELGLDFTKEVPIQPGDGKSDDTIQRVPVESLPSHRETQRWDLSKRLNSLMDSLLPKLALVTQKVNTYTGTDYSGIEALRREIESQETLVKTRRSLIDDRKQLLDAAHAQRASSQKEVVALLERKHSWSATDLERYMSLIRSEHVNDQAVRDAKEAVLAAESALEDARQQLEKRERARYHEEQIWSDTIRRNSTWVTFGLMGLNIFLLLLSFVVLEPFRRRRIVREIKSALEAQKPVVEAAPAAAAAAVAPVPPPAVAIEGVIEGAVEQPVEPVAQIQAETPAEPASTALPPPPTEIDPSPALAQVAEVEDTIDTPSSPPPPSDTANPITEPSADMPAPIVDLEPVESLAAVDIPAEPNSPKFYLQWIQTRFEDLKSEDVVSVRKRDMTATALMGVAAGWCVSTVVYLLMTTTSR